MLDLISLLPARNITEIVHYERKSVALIISKPMFKYFRSTECEFFLPPYRSVIKRPTDSATGTVSGQAATTSG